MEKINIAELLKDCPKGMELDCTMFENVKFDGIDYAYSKIFPIRLKRNDGCRMIVTEYGQRDNVDSAKCVIFPKGKTTWEGFQRPFKDGDIIYIRDEYSDATFTYVAILKQIKGEQIYSYCFYDYQSDKLSTDDYLYDGYNIRFATEEEKAELFDAIKANGYKWNSETKTLEKLPKFKVGDKITFRCEEDKPIISITGVKGNYYLVQYFNIIKGDYQNEKISFEFQDNYKLVPDKFDITTLKPFDKVLVKTTHYDEVWSAAIFSHINADYFLRFWTTAGRNYEQCIPFMGNEHLLGTTDDCDEYFKTWK